VTKILYDKIYISLNFDREIASYLTR